VKLYRQDKLDLYHVTVFASMREVTTKAGETLLWFGKNDLNRAHFKAALLSGEDESPVFEWIGRGGYLRRTANGFEQWLEDCRRRARKKYSKRRWREILCGPEPFSEEESRIVQARRQYRWRRVGVADDGDVEFEVHNESDVTLPYLSIGIRGAINGGAWLPVGHIRPGETRIVLKDCYKDVASPDEIEPFDLPDPIPEDRDRYWEFRDVEHE